MEGVWKKMPCLLKDKCTFKQWDLIGGQRWRGIGAEQMVEEGQSCTGWQLLVCLSGKEQGKWVCGRLSRSEGFAVLWKPEQESPGTFLSYSFWSSTGQVLAGQGEVLAHTQCCFQEKSRSVTSRKFLWTCQMYVPRPHPAIRQSWVRASPFL